MTINSRITLAIKKFFKKFGKIIFIVLFIWLIVFFINLYLLKKPEELIATNTYNPDTPIIDYGGKVPNKDKEEVNETLESFLNYCKTKDYENAFNMLSDNCKNYLYNNNIEDFKKYVDAVYTEYNNYSYTQNYSNKDDVYIYDVTTLNSDILATGTTGGYDTYKDRISIITENGVKKIANQGYIKNINISKEIEDDYMRIKVISKDCNYDQITYNLEITNKTDNTIVIADNKANQEITLNLEGEYLNVENVMTLSGVIKPGQTVKTILVFNKFFDSNREESQINFNYIRVMQDYDSNMSLDEQREKANRIYSLNIELQ